MLGGERERERERQRVRGFHAKCFEGYFFELRAISAECISGVEPRFGVSGVGFRVLGLGSRFRVESHIALTKRSEKFKSESMHPRTNNSLMNSRPYSISVHPLKKPRVTRESQNQIPVNP